MCTKNDINIARRYRRGIVPKSYATVAWIGLLPFLLNIILLNAGVWVGGIALAAAVIFSIRYLLLQSAWETLTVKEKAIHIALTRENPKTGLRAPVFC